MVSVGLDGLPGGLSSIGSCLLCVASLLPHAQVQLGSRVRTWDGDASHKPRKPLGVGRGAGRTSLQPWRELSPADTLMRLLASRPVERINFCCCKSCSFWVLCNSSPGN